MNAPSELRTHRGTQRELVPAAAGAFFKSLLARHLHAEHVGSWPFVASASRDHESPRRHEDGGGDASSIKTGHVRWLSSLRVEMDRWKLERDGAAEELFPFPFSIGCIKVKRQLRGGARCPFTEADL